GAAARRDHRGAAGERLDHDEAERLLPLDREERHPRVLEQLDLLAVVDLAEVLDVAAEMRLDELAEVGLLLRVVHLPSDLQRQPRLRRDRDRAMAAFVGAQSPEE